MDEIKHCFSCGKELSKNEHHEPLFATGTPEYVCSDPECDKTAQEYLNDMDVEDGELDR